MASRDLLKVLKLMPLCAEGAFETVGVFGKVVRSQRAMIAGYEVKAVRGERGQIVVL